MPSEQMKRERLEAFAQKCQEKGFRNTPQKRAIFLAIASSDAHPTAQEIFQEVKMTFPSMAFATVYKNLKKFLELEMIREIDLSDGTIRYDANMEDHHHLINLSTGMISDVYCDEEIPVPKTLNGQRLERISVNYYVS